ncbi:RHS repeat-associated core domain-containing protein [Paenibacillus sp. NPDC058071]|uniref:TreTu family toxin n=1 Tax=Paenibacillus sp. NPDC058071 TaxID=3346326 RepID=UPI0036DD6656
MDHADHWSYYLFNGHGDVVQTVDRNGSIENQYDYDAFGNTTLSVEQYANAIRYAGEFYDQEVGLYYLRARYYDPYISRFITEDTYRGEQKDPLSLNLYTYVLNNPLIHWDPTGNITFKKGSSGDQVVAIQELLKSAGYYSWVPDGKFGPNTESAVRRFQEDKKLQVDGIVGNQTLATLNSVNRPMHEQHLYPLNNASVGEIKTTTPVMSSGTYKSTLKKIENTKKAAGKKARVTYEITDNKIKITGVQKDTDKKNEESKNKNSAKPTEPMKPTEPTKSTKPTVTSNPLKPNFPALTKHMKSVVVHQYNIEKEAIKHTFSSPENFLSDSTFGFSDPFYDYYRSEWGTKENWIAQGQIVVNTTLLVAGSRSPGTNAIKPAVKETGKAAISGSTKAVGITVSSQRVGQWMSKAEYDGFVKTGTIPRTNVLTKGKQGFEKQANSGDYYVEFDIDSSLLMEKDIDLGWSLVKSKNQTQLKLAEKRGQTLPDPTGTNIKHVDTKR